MFRQLTFQNINITLRYAPLLARQIKLHKSTVAGRVNNLTDDVVDFRNPQTAFCGITTTELLRSSLIYRMCSYKLIVKHHKTLMNIAKKLLGATLFKKLMQMSFYGQFVAGENQDTIQPLIMRYRHYGVKSILDYSIERDIPESEMVKKMEDCLEEVIHVPDKTSSAAVKQYQPSLEFADRRKDVVSARTYFYESEAQCDENMNVFMSCIDASSRGVAKEGFVAIKLTSLGRPQFLLQFSDVLVQMERIFNALIQPDTSKRQIPSSLGQIDLDFFQRRLEEMGIEISVDTSTNLFTLLDTTGDGVVDLLEWLHLKNFEHDLAPIFQVKNKQTGKTEQLVPTLTPQGVTEMRSMMQRMDNLARYAKSKGVRLMIDAEQSYFQPAIFRLTMEMMRRFNKEHTVVFGTYQCYLRETLNRLTQDLKIAQSEDFFFGAKLVRGAYIEQERRRAQQLGYPDPVNPNYEATSKMYEACFEAILSAIERRPRGKVSVMVATHNEDSVRFALRCMRDHDIHPEHKLVCFAQLFGMCDHISFPLANAGFSVYKYLPYGPVEEVLPYLSRRVQENQSILSDLSVERYMRWRELRRRFLARDFALKSPSA